MKSSLDSGALDRFIEGVTRPDASSNQLDDEETWLEYAERTIEDILEILDNDSDYRILGIHAKFGLIRELLITYLQEKERGENNG